MVSGRYTYMRIDRIAFIFTVLLSSAALLSVAPGAAAATTGPRELPLAAPLTNELNLVLKAGDGLHKSLVNHDEEQIEMGIRDMLWQLEKAQGALVHAKMHERGHLIRILEAASDDFEITQRAFGDERRLRLAAAYNQLVNLARIYQLDRSYSIFFCPKDRTTWIQKGTAGLNPFSRESGKDHCGIRVPK